MYGSRCKRFHYKEVPVIEGIKLCVENEGDYFYNQKYLFSDANPYIKAYFKIYFFYYFKQNK